VEGEVRIITFTRECKEHKISRAQKHKHKRKQIRNTREIHLEKKEDDYKKLQEHSIRINKLQGRSRYELDDLMLYVIFWISTNAIFCLSCCLVLCIHVTLLHSFTTPVFVSEPNAQPCCYLFSRCSTASSTEPSKQPPPRLTKPKNTTLTPPISHQIPSQKPHTLPT